MTSYNAEKREAEKMMRAADEKLLIKELGPYIYISREISIEQPSVGLASLAQLHIHGHQPDYITLLACLRMGKKHMLERIAFTKDKKLAI